MRGTLSFRWTSWDVRHWVNVAKLAYGFGVPSSLWSGAGIRAAFQLHRYHEIGRERLRRERTARVLSGARANGLRYDSFHADLKLRDAEIMAPAGFRKQLYDYDVVPVAREPARYLGLGNGRGNRTALLR